jgi:microfibrillar-associated protein 1
MPPPKKLTANPTRPARHFVGKPRGAVEESSDEEDSDSEQEEESKEPAKKQLASIPAASSFPKKAEPSKSASAHNAYVKAISKQVAHSDEESDEDEESGSEESGSESGSEEESEDESSSDDNRRKMMRPVFIKKGARPNGNTAPVKSEEDLQEEESARRQAEADAQIQSVLNQRSVALKEQAAQFEDDDNVRDDVDDTDEVDPKAEYMAWAIRALKRQKRDQEERLRWEKEREDRERWESLPEEQRKAEQEEKIRMQQEEKQGRNKMAFLQKYHHGGAFYQETLEEAGLADRNVMGAKFEDEVDRSSLPQFMQIRDMTKLGKKGQTRHRDLKTDDTGTFGGYTAKRRPGQQSDYDLDDRYRSDFDRDGPGATGANASTLGERRRQDWGDGREAKKQRIDEKS